MGWRVIWLLRIDRTGDGPVDSNLKPWPLWVRLAAFGLAVIGAAAVLIWKGL